MAMGHDLLVLLGPYCFQTTSIVPDDNGFVPVGSKPTSFIWRIQIFWFVPNADDLNWVWWAHVCSLTKPLSTAGSLGVQFLFTLDSQQEFKVQIPGNVFPVWTLELDLVTGNYAKRCGCPAVQWSVEQNAGTAGKICLKHFWVFPELLIALRSQRMPNHTNTWSHQTAAMNGQRIWIKPNQKVTQPKDDASCQFPAFRANYTFHYFLSR